jgi:hypothetical protein
MRDIQKIWLFFLFFCVCLPRAWAVDIKSYRIVSVEVTGIERTQHDWIMDYIAVEQNQVLDAGDLARIKIKLLSTNLFRTVDVEPYQTITLGDYQLHVHVTEKWTTIPVVRGAFGGGTPLRVLGLYDINAFGRYLTLGGEMRQYGDAPPGFVVYGRSPKADSGRYYLGGEFWRSIRERTFYTPDGDQLGSISTNAAITRMNLLRPIGPGSAFGENTLRYGLDITFIRESASILDLEFEVAPEAIEFDGVELNEKPQSSFAPLVTLVYDDVAIENVNMHGLRSLVKAGPQFDAEKTHGVVELESFWYYALPNDLNLATHVHIGTNSSSSLQSQYYLGGLDSIRGYPDGIVYGKKMAYSNFEMRKLLRSFKYLWFQPVVFYDVGMAGSSWDVAQDQQRAAVGAGIRFDVPQVYRLMFRIDYAWATDGSGQQGITAGMNQFFQPYRPL